MITLGIELSTQQGSVALLKDGELLAEKTWVGERVRHGVLFQNLEALLKEVHISYNDISLYAVGRGPGSFSGMRMAFAAAQALALPDKTEVRAVSSGAALALQVAQALPPAEEWQTRASAPRENGQTAVFTPQNIAVVGDARRGQVWIGFFNVDATPSSRSERKEKNATRASRLQFSKWKLVPYKEVSIPEGTVVVSPDADRLREYLPQLKEARFPHAQEVAEMALKQAEPEPLEPLYMHPPVFVQPKYLEN